MECFYCQKEILEGQEYCSLVSHDKTGAISHEDHWHRKCFSDWIADKVDKRVTQLATALKEQAMPLIKAKFGDAGMMPSILA